MSRAVSTPNSNRGASTGLRAPIPRVVALVAVSSTLASCASESTPADGQDAQSEAGRDGGAAVTPAIYQTTLAFLGFGAPPTGLFLRLKNRTSAENLQLSYDGWLRTDSGWRSVLGVRESTDVPRAAWRVLPVGPLRVSVVEGEELAGLTIDGVAGRPRLRIGERLADWASVTGQRESLRRATVEMEGTEQSGILIASQTARVAGAAFRDDERAILLSDSLGNALVILRSGTSADAQVVVHTLLGEQSRRWDGATLEDAGESDDPGNGADAGADASVDTASAGAQGLRLVVPGAGIEAEIVVEAVPSTAGEEARIDLPAASGVVTVDGGEPLAMSGFQVALSGDGAEMVEP